MRFLSYISHFSTQQLGSSCIGGHGTSPNEQNTQQSPCKGFNNSAQALHS
jgi:hypothetical protein